ncbi:MAG: discoidin domain-containing protein, partial [Gemmatimonadetes bacterium]|nr:discoidin domain-containing protein [Gemmatimonadota bacterium]
MCNRLAAKIRTYLSILGALLLAVQAPGAEELRLGGLGGWSAWTLPGDAVDVADGVLKPVFVRQNIDAVQNAATFGGGIRAAGTALGRAPLLIDGNVETAWTPAGGAPREDGWIEVDLGRVVSARTIRLHFAEGGAPLEFFKVFTSDGEPFFTNAGVAIEGTLRYNKRRLYSFNQDRIIEIDFDLKPLQHIRIQADKKTLGTQ